MPKAGFWAIGGAELSFRRDGKWYADEEVIGNRRIAELFSRHVRGDGQGGWVIDLGIDRQPCRVEDTPLVVTAVDDDPDRGLLVRANDGETDPLDLESLRLGQGNVLYCKLGRGERGALEARFLRPAYYQIARFMEVDDRGALLRAHGRTVRVAARSA